MVTEASASKALDLAKQAEEALEAAYAALQRTHVSYTVLRAFRSMQELAKEELDLSDD